MSLSQISFIKKEENSFDTLNDSVFSIVNAMGEDKKKREIKKESYKKSENKDINYPKFTAEKTNKKNTFNSRPGMKNKENNICSYSVNKSIEGSIGFSYFDDDD